MSQSSRKFWTLAVTGLVIFGLLSGLLMPLANLRQAHAAVGQATATPSYITGPVVGPTIYASQFTGDVRSLPPISQGEDREAPPPGVLKQLSSINSEGSATFADPVLQKTPASGQMPEPNMNFAGLSRYDAGGWIPPDTNGDVGPDVYIQTVNVGIGIYDKTSGDNIATFSYNDLFDGTGTACDNQNVGDVIVLYDSQVDRWIVTDFALPAGGPFYECIAVSMTGDPVSGGWWFYALQANTDYFSDSFNDYPKLGVWADGWFMSANMFIEGDGFKGVRVWALNRTAMIAGTPTEDIHFDCKFSESNNCQSLLPANIRGALPPTGAPDYFANIIAPNTLNIWQFHVDWENPGSSTFTGPVARQVADFQYANLIPQKNTTQLLDSLGDRMMYSLQYRNLDGYEALYANHSVNSNGISGIRWYEIHDPGGTPVVYQQGTYLPDSNYRWMGSIAADQDGNIAVGYSVSSSDMYPAIRYAGRLVGETLNQLTQGEFELVQGSGSQQGQYGDRWGDYSSMTVDPVDDCTFWYTQEYLLATGTTWQTRIGSFRYPSCGLPKGTISGYVYDSVSNLPLEGVPILAQGSYDFSTVTDESGYYSMDLIAGSYNLTAGPLLPGYPVAEFAGDVPVVTGETTNQDFFLDPAPSLVHVGTIVADPHGNGNGFPEPGEQDINLSEILHNQGAIPSTDVSARLTSLTEGVTVNTAQSSYPDIAPGSEEPNTTPYVFSIAPSVPCGTDLNFQALITDSYTTYNTSFTLNASVPMPREDVFSNTVENGAMGWTTGGTPNSWAITTLDSHSPTHSWTDSPAGNYQDNSDNWVRTPELNLTGKRNIQLSGWFKFALEAGYDYVYLEYSLDNGSTWNNPPLAVFNGFSDWQYGLLDANVLANQAHVALRLHLVSDAGVTEDGIYLDDMALSYEPFECTFASVPNAPSLVSPANGSAVTTPVTFVWQPPEGGPTPQGYIVYLDETPAVTLTELVTSTIVDVLPGPHTWFVKATNNAGSSEQSPTWSLEVLPAPDAPSLVAPDNGAVKSSPVTFVWQPAAGGSPPEGYILYIDETPVVTFTTPITSTTLVEPPGVHNWFVKATNGTGTSVPSPAWSFDIYRDIFLPLVNR